MSPQTRCFDLPRGDGTAHGCAVQHVGKRQIVDVQRLAGDFLAPSLRGNDLPMG
jgi:hypothetical protein